MLYVYLFTQLLSSSIPYVCTGNTTHIYYSGNLILARDCRYDRLIANYFIGTTFMAHYKYVKFLIDTTCRPTTELLALTGFNGTTTPVCPHVLLQTLILNCF